MNIFVLFLEYIRFKINIYIQFSKYIEQFCTITDFQMKKSNKLFFRLSFRMQYMSNKYVTFLTLNYCLLSFPVYVQMH